MKNIHNFFEYLIFLNKEERTWYKFTNMINKTVKKDLDHIFVNKEVAYTIHPTTDYNEPKVIVKGLYDTYWRVYFINKSNASVAYLTPGGHVIIEELFTKHDNINKIYQTNRFGISNYHTHVGIKYKVKHESFIDKWLETYTEDVLDETGKFVRRIKAKDINDINNINK